MKQSMVATAAMQMFMRTLQATTQELQQLAQQQVTANPALEWTETEFLPMPNQAGSSSSQDYLIGHLVESPTLTSHLEEQIRRSALPSTTEKTALMLIRHLDNRGFFETHPDTIAQQEGISLRLLHKALAAIRDMEPPGVGAIDLRDSLMLQLIRKDEQQSLPMQLLEQHWDAFIRHRYAEIAASLNVSEEAVMAAARRIARLSPNPGAVFESPEHAVIQPDLEVEIIDGEPIARLTGENIPRLALSSAYRDMMAEQADKPEVRHYLSRCFREGRAFINAIEERQKTILLVAQSIVSRQRDFFLKGAKHLKALKMENIATLVGLHLSTVSRAVNGKYLRYAGRLYELRSFFSAALSTTEGDQVSSRSIQEIIRELIAQESPSKPLSDEQIRHALQQEGIDIARRTIAKYRDQLKILPASLRKHSQN